MGSAPFTRYVFRAHTWLGLLGGTGLLLVALTGALIAWSGDIERLTAAPVRVVGVPAGGRPLPYDTLLAQARRTLPAFQRYDFLRLPTAPDEAVELLYFPDDSYHSAFLNPYTGQVTGTLCYTLTRTLTRFHWSFFLNDFGAALALVVAIALVGSGLTGLIVYRRHLTDALFWRIPLRGLSRSRLISSLHRIVGVWAALFGLLLGSTGFWINYQIITGVYAYPEGEALERPPVAPLRISIDQVLHRARRHLPGLRPQWVSIPQLQGGPVTVGGDFATDGALWQVGSSVDFDPMTGRLLAVHDGRGAATSAKALHAFETLHYGQFGGWPIRLLYSAAGLALTSLPLTGALLWWRRTRSRRRTTASR